MMFQVSNTARGYVVEAYVITDTNSLIGYWKPLRNFGERQGDARAFYLYDCPNLTDLQLRELIRRYDAERVFERRRKGQYRVRVND